MIRGLYPLLDPPGGKSKFVRKLTREKQAAGREYVGTVRSDESTLRDALESAGYRYGHLFSTVKYVETDTGYSWELFNLAKNRFNPGCGECQHHCYTFEGSENRIHLHHHREYPIVRPVKHQSNTLRTAGDPDHVLRDALEAAGLEWVSVDSPVYR